MFREPLPWPACPLTQCQLNLHPKAPHHDVRIGAKGRYLVPQPVDGERILLFSGPLTWRHAKERSGSNRDPAPLLLPRPEQLRPLPRQPRRRPRRDLLQGQRARADQAWTPSPLSTHTSAGDARSNSDALGLGRIRGQRGLEEVNVLVQTVPVYLSPFCSRELRVEERSWLIGSRSDSPRTAAVRSKMARMLVADHPIALGMWM